jgi:hypothetical protein
MILFFTNKFDERWKLTKYVGWRVMDAIPQTMALMVLKKGMRLISESIL